MSYSNTQWINNRLQQFHQLAGQAQQLSNQIQQLTSEVQQLINQLPAAPIGTVQTGFQTSMPTTSVSQGTTNFGASNFGASNFGASNYGSSYPTPVIQSGNTYMPRH